MHKEVQQAKEVAKKSREDVMGMQERVQIAQKTLQNAQDATGKAQHLGTIELVKSQEHAANIQEYAVSNAQLHRRLQETELKFNEQLDQAEEQKQQAEEQALGRVLQAEGEIQRAQQAEKEALDRVLTAEDAVRQAQDAERTASDRASLAEAEKQQALRAVEDMRNQAALSVQVSDLLLREAEAQYTREKEQLANQVEDARQQFTARIQREFVEILENKLGGLETEVEGAEERLRMERKRYDDFTREYNELEQHHKDVLLQLESDKLRPQNQAQLNSAYGVKFGKEDEQDNADIYMFDLDYDSTTASAEVASRKRRRRPKKRPQSSQERALESTPALTATSTSTGTSSSASPKPVKQPRYRNKVRQTSPLGNLAAFAYEISSSVGD